MFKMELQCSILIRVSNLLFFYKSINLLKIRMKATFNEGFKDILLFLLLKINKTQEK